MQYKTIIHELLPQYPTLYERLRQNRQMLAALDQYALSLKTRHQAWINELAVNRPGSHPTQLSSEALELALEETQADLQNASEGSETESSSA
jgi:hypothetical protein